MDVKILQQEEEFHRYNAQLELKTSALMKEVEKVMTIQDTFIVSPKVIRRHERLEKARYKSGIRSCDGVSEECDSKFSRYSSGAGTLSARSESLNSLLSPREAEPTIRSAGENSPSDIFGEKKKPSASENIIRILNSRIKVLQNEVNTLRSDIRKKDEELKKCQNYSKQLEEEKGKALSQIGALKEEKIQCHASSSELASKLHIRDSENAALKKEVDNLKKELKTANQAVNHNEVRMNRALEEIDKLKSALQESNISEKEMRASARRNTDQLTSVIRKLEKQKAEILHAFRKQAQLIENLKAQKEVQEAASMVKSAEKHFSDLLENMPSLGNSKHAKNP
ncbi:chromosome partition protein Smc-like [Ischnura elegans]|uniref:chromosome partition protein Smc-like n=1 Tax=Ischnura elegans TaxID=197161 RepID=UPI001ED883D0|nr:chromosome partition protein Smc-like [Ischnura elegans]